MKDQFGREIHTTYYNSNGNMFEYVILELSGRYMDAHDKSIIFDPHIFHISYDVW